MTLKEELLARSGGTCELCNGDGALAAYPVPPESGEEVDRCVFLCTTCSQQAGGDAPIDAEHWRALTDVMWSTTPAVQVMVWRMLQSLRAHAWAAEALEMLYLDDETRSWAEAAPIVAAASTEEVVHRDANGTALEPGDTVTLIKDLNVKGAGFTAKRGTAVRGIGLVRENAAHIEGRINGQQIVILTEFVKKSG